MIKTSYKYYKGLLKNRNDRLVYDCILEGIEMHSRSISIERPLWGSVNNSIEIIMKYIFLDNPGIFYIDKKRMHVIPNSKSKCIELGYLYDDKEIEKLEKKMMDKISTLIRFGKEQKLSSDYAWELFIHDFIASQVDYEKGDTSYHKVHSVIGGLQFHRSVCEGYSKAFKLVCDAVNIPCLVIFGTADGKKEGRNGMGGHAWNLVNIGGHFYHVDPTWDSCTKRGEEVSHTHFNITDKDISADHDWDKTIFPKCDSSRHNYYVVNNKRFESISHCKDYLNRMIKNGEKKVSFQLMNCTYNHNDIESLIQSSVSAVSHWSNVVYSIDENRGVIRIELN